MQANHIIQMPYLTLIPQANHDIYENRTDKQEWKFDNADQLRRGDLFLYVYGLSYDGDDHAPDGFPLLKSYNNIPLHIREIRRAEIRTDPKDGFVNVFFKDADIDIGGDDLHPEIVEAIRLCATGREFIEIDLPLFFKFTQ